MPEFTPLSQKARIALRRSHRLGRQRVRFELVRDTARATVRMGDIVASVLDCGGQPEHESLARIRRRQSGALEKLGAAHAALRLLDRALDLLQKKAKEELSP